MWFGFGGKMHPLVELKIMDGNRESPYRSYAKKIVNSNLSLLFDCA